MLLPLIFGKGNKDFQNILSLWKISKVFSVKVIQISKKSYLFEKYRKSKVNKKIELYKCEIIITCNMKI